MATVQSTAKDALSSDDLSQQIDALRADLKKLVNTISGEVSDGVGQAGQQINQTGRDIHKSATNTVLDHPLAAVGIAAAVGLMLGLMTRKG